MSRGSIDTRHKLRRSMLLRIQSAGRDPGGRRLLQVPHRARAVEVCAAAAEGGCWEWETAREAEAGRLGRKIHGAQLML